MKESRKRQQGYVQIVLVLDSEQNIALQQGSVVVVDFRRPPILLQENHVLQNHHRLRVTRFATSHHLHDEQQSHFHHEVVIQTYR